MENKNGEKVMLKERSLDSFHSNVTVDLRESLLFFCQYQNISSHVRFYCGN